jgi:hypothetical protein
MTLISPIQRLQQQQQLPLHHQLLQRLRLRRLRGGAHTRLQDASRLVVRIVWRRSN